MDAPGQLPQLFERLRELLRRAAEQRVGRARVVAELRLGEPQREREGHEALLGAVVEVSLQLPPRLVTGGHDARP